MNKISEFYKSESEMKREMLQLVSQKYKILSEIIMNNYIAMNFIMQKEWVDCQAHAPYQD